MDENETNVAPVSPGGAEAPKPEPRPAVLVAHAPYCEETVSLVEVRGDVKIGRRRRR
jgi:hypothetical protein